MVPYYDTITDSDKDMDLGQGNIYPDPILFWKVSKNEAITLKKFWMIHICIQIHDTYI